MTAALPVDERRAVPIGAATAWRRHGALLAGAVIIILVLFGHDTLDLAQLWWTSTTFGHCLFIGPVIAWLVWQRRHDLAALTPSAWATGLALTALGGFGWLIGEAAGVALARHLGLVMMLQGAVVTILGPQVARGLLFPFAYAFFLVPFGESLEGPLQAVTVRMTMALLHAAGVAAQVDGVLITIPNGYFEVAEACSGAKFVIAMLAFGTLVANVCYVRWGRRIAFMAMALVVPVIANGLRSFGTIYAAYLTSVERATGWDHIVYGWIFFGVVMAAVLAIGWHWFDRDPDARWFAANAVGRAPTRPVDAVLAAVLVLAVAAMFPAWGSAIAARASVLPARIALPVVPGWHRLPANLAAPWSPSYPGADHFLFGRYGDDRGHEVDLAIAVYGAQHEGKELVGFGIGAVRQDDRWVRVEGLAPIAGGRAIRITAPGPVERIVATWYRLGGITTTSDGIVKLETLKAKLLGGAKAAVAVHLSAQVSPGGAANAAIDRFVSASGGIARIADRAAGRAR